MHLDPARARQCLRDFNLKGLFVEELGWEHHAATHGRLSLNYPKRYHPQSAASEDSAVSAAPHRHRKVGTSEFPGLGPFSLAFRWPARCVRFQRGRCSNEAVPSASRYHLERVVFPPVERASDLRLSRRNYLSAVYPGTLLKL